MTRVKSLIVALVPLLLLTACASEPIISGEAHPPMWEARFGATRIVMLGSVHQLPPELDWQDARVRAAIDGADQLWLELAPDQLPGVAALFERVSADERVASLDRRLGRESAERVRDIVAASGVDGDDAERMESWGLAIISGVQLARDAGLTADNGVETRLTERFQSAGKPIFGLEDPSTQFSAFDDLTDNAQTAMLRSVVDGAGASRSRMQRLLTAWARADASQIERDSVAELARVPGLADAVVVRRNRAWAVRIDGWRDRGDQLLVAVGTGHLVGPAGLPQLLANAGWQVRPIP